MPTASVADPANHTVINYLLSNHHELVQPSSTLGFRAEKSHVQKAQQHCPGVALEHLRTPVTVGTGNTPVQVLGKAMARNQGLAGHPGADPWSQWL